MHGAMRASWPRSAIAEGVEPSPEPTLASPSYTETPECRLSTVSYLAGLGRRVRTACCGRPVRCCRVRCPRCRLARRSPLRRTDAARRTSPEALASAAELAAVDVAAGWVGFLDRVELTRYAIKRGLVEPRAPFGSTADPSFETPADPQTSGRTMKRAADERCARPLTAARGRASPTCAGTEAPSAPS